MRLQDVPSPAGSVCDHRCCAWAAVRIVDSIICFQPTSPSTIRNCLWANLPVVQRTQVFTFSFCGRCSCFVGSPQLVGGTDEVHRMDDYDTVKLRRLHETGDFTAGTLENLDANLSGPNTQRLSEAVAHASGDTQIVLVVVSTVGKACVEVVQFAGSQRQVARQADVETAAQGHCERTGCSA